MRLTYAAVIAAGAVLSSNSVWAADDDSNQVVFNNVCRTCHTTVSGDNRLGPNLAGLIGRKAGSVEGYGYSSSMKNSAVIWDAKTLDQFIADPDAVVPGNNMKPFSGITNAEERGKIVAFLSQDSGKK
jgi:cytochrome c